MTLYEITSRPILMPYAYPRILLASCAHERTRLLGYYAINRRRPLRHDASNLSPETEAVAAVLSDRVEYSVPRVQRTHVLRGTASVVLALAAQVQVCPKRISLTLTKC